MLVFLCGFVCGVFYVDVGVDGFSYVVWWWNWISLLCWGIKCYIISVGYVCFLVVCGSIKGVFRSVSYLVYFCVLVGFS